LMTPSSSGANTSAQSGGKSDVAPVIA